MNDESQCCVDGPPLAIRHHPRRQLLGGLLHPINTTPADETRLKRERSSSQDDIESRATRGRVDLVRIIGPEAVCAVTHGADCGDDSHEDEGQEHSVFDRGGRLVVPVESQQLVEHWRTLEENPGSSLVAVVPVGYELEFEPTR